MLGAVWLLRELRHERWHSYTTTDFDELDLEAETNRCFVEDYSAVGHDDSGIVDPNIRTFYRHNGTARWLSRDPGHGEICDVSLGDLLGYVEAGMAPGSAAVYHATTEADSLQDRITYALNLLRAHDTYRDFLGLYRWPRADISSGLDLISRMKESGRLAGLTRTAMDALRLDDNANPVFFAVGFMRDRFMRGWFNVEWFDEEPQGFTNMATPKYFKFQRATLGDLMRHIEESPRDVPSFADEDLVNSVS